MHLDDDAGSTPAPPRPRAGVDLRARARRRDGTWRSADRRPNGRTPPGDLRDTVRTQVARDDRVVVHVSGALDVYTVNALREVLLDVVAADFTDVVVVLSGVRFVDSTGLGVLVGAHKRVRSRGGRLRLVVDQQSVLTVIRMTSLHRVLCLYPTLEAALAA